MIQCEDEMIQGEDEMIQVLRMPCWGFCLHNAEYYGWRYGLHIGPVLVFWGRMK